MSYEQSMSVKADLVKFIVDAQNELAVNINAGVIAATPVDTGEARAGWTMLLTKELGVSEIYNHVEHIVYLNNGSSRQAPKLFVETAIDVAVGDR